MDPLSALREYTTRNSLDKIMSVGGDLHFGNDYSFPSRTPTSYRSKQGNLYTLETVLFLLRNQSLKHVDYMHATHSAGVPPVTLPDRKPLIDYLHGRLPTLDQIDPSAAVILADSNLNDVSNVNITNNFEFSDDKTEAVPAAVIRKRERPLKDTEAVLECRNKDFYKVYVQGMKREEEKMRSELQGRKDGLVAKTRLTVNEGFDGGEKASVMKGVPIILVPSASQTLITIYNVKEFLEDGVFVASDVKAKGAGGKPECVTVQKRLGSKDSRGVAAYEVRDKAVGFKQEDWDRVVAVFVLGKEWQFKDWPYTNPVEIFNKIIGFYVRFEDDSIESAKTVKQWNVKIISISKNKRHQDRAAALEVWDRLEAFMRSRSHT